LNRDEFARIVAAQANDALARSGMTMRTLPADETQALINAIAEGVFHALSELHDEEAAIASDRPDEPARGGWAAQTAQAQPLAGSALPEESLRWRGRPYLTIGTIYELTTQRLRVVRGLLGHAIEEMELVRVRDTKVAQSAGERLLNIGDVTVVSADATTPEIVLRNITNPVKVRELIRKAVQEERQRRNLYYREDIDNDVSQL
jgi:hypothetical protein